ncbi:hypothetical protein TNCV_1336321 [Trichonephila clavipes]|nr:hypothetical protein TNCV_1336321 [Trichonephila clavipes]
MSYDNTICKRSLECLFGLGALGKAKSQYRFTSSELLPLGRKLDIKITCGNWYPPIWCRTKKRYQLPGNVLDAGSTGIGKGTTFVMARFKIPVEVFTLTTLTRPSLP